MRYRMKANLRIETVRASELLAQGHTASDCRPLGRNTVTNESHVVRDPAIIQDSR